MKNSSDLYVFFFLVEEPSEKFQALRDFVDIALCKSLPCFEPTELKKDFNKQIVAEVRKTLKFNEKQIRRIYEILRLSITDTNNAEEYKKYKGMVRQRLAAPFAVRKSFFFTFTFFIFI